jgi:hypothetical protein
MERALLDKETAPSLTLVFDMVHGAPRQFFFTYLVALVFVG